jgi:hypothetical protein
MNMAERLEVLTYRFINAESMTGVVKEREFYQMEEVYYVSDGQMKVMSVATETVTPCVFHSDEEGELTEVTTDVDNFPPVRLFMQHVAGIASQGFHDVRELSSSDPHPVPEGETDEATDGDDDDIVTPIRTVD